MRRRIVFSTDELLGELKTPEAVKVACSKGMEAAASFAGRFQTMALMPKVGIFTSGTPMENGCLYCDSPVRRELLDLIEKSSLISIVMRYGKSSALDGEDKRAIICEVTFRKSSRVIKIVSFYFLLENGNNVQTSHHAERNFMS